jgi:hypothetical protein
MRRPMLHPCSHDGCCTLTLGELCVAHEPPVLRTFHRGRPFPPRRPRAQIAGALAEPAAAS